jgi:hypothetical protein
MAIDLACPCGKRLRVSDECAGLHGRCPVCGQVLQIPSRSSPDPQAGLAAYAAKTEAVTDAPELQAPDETALPAYPEPPLFIRPDYRLFSPGDVALGTLLGGPVGGLLVLGLNYRRLGNSAAVALTAVSAVVVTIGFVALSLVVSGTSPFCFLSVLGILGMYVIAKGLQGRIYEAHLEVGGQKGSGGAAAGLGLVGAVLYLGLFLGLFFVGAGLFGDKRITFGPQEEILYTRDISDEEARRLGRALQDAGWFTGRGPISVRLSKEEGRFVVAFVVQPGVWNDGQVIEEFRQMGKHLSQQVFNGKAVEVQLCDEYLRPKKKLR